MAKQEAAQQTTATVEPATTIDPVAETPAPAPPLSSSSATSKSSSRSDDPLDVEHYIPRLPLQLAAIAFALVAPVAAAAATGARTSAVPRPAEVLAAWIQSPRETLAFQSALVAVVQVWFGYWARTCRDGSGARNHNRRGGTRVVERSRSTARRTAPKGFGAIMNHLWRNDLRNLGTESILRGGEGANRNFGGIDYSVSFLFCSRALALPSPRTLIRRMNVQFVPETILVTLLATGAFHASAVLLGAPLIACVFPNWPCHCPTFPNSELIPPFAVVMPSSPCYSACCSPSWP